MASSGDKDAKGRFRQFLEGTLADDFGAVPSDDLDTNALAPAAEQQGNKASGGPSLKEILLGPGPRFEDLVPKRGRLRRGRLWNRIEAPSAPPTRSDSLLNPFLPT